MPQTLSQDTIALRLAEVRGRIAEAALRANRRPEDVTLIAVSKTKPAEAIREALSAGQAVFGENRVQEAAAKFPPLRAETPGLVLHLIGGLQTNKAREAVRIADVIETLDRPRIADALAAAMDQEGRRPRLLVEVNTGEEPQKSGIPRADADAFIRACKDRFGPSVIGLMCIPPLDQDPVPHFAWLAERAAKHGTRRGVDGDVSRFRAGDRPRRDLGPRRQRDLRRAVALTRRCAPTSPGGRAVFYFASPSGRGRDGVAGPGEGASSAMRMASVT